jgi:hypothetical protein
VQDTVGQRLAECKRIVRLTTLIGAGLLAEVTVFNALHPNTAGAALFEALFATFFLATGLFAALARGGCEWQVDLIEFLKAAGTIDDSMAIGDAVLKSRNTIKKDIPWETLEYNAAVGLIVLPGIILLLLAWFSFFWPKPAEVQSQAPIRPGVSSLAPTGSLAPPVHKAPLATAPSSSMTPAGSTTPAGSINPAPAGAITPPPRKAQFPP